MLGLSRGISAAGAAVAAGLVTTGGWAVVTVKELPEYLVAGREYRVEFQVRQHGTHLLAGLEPALIVRRSDRPRLLGGDAGAKVRALGLPAPGSYAATFTAPGGGAERVFLTIENGFGSELRLYPIAVVRPGTAPAPPGELERGQALFVAKGCNTCHQADLPNRPDNARYDVGPGLAGRRLPAQLVVAKLTGPASQRMPDLELADAEVRALAAFLSGSAEAGRAESEGGRGRGDARRDRP